LILFDDDNDELQKRLPLPFAVLLIVSFFWHVRLVCFAKGLKMLGNSKSGNDAFGGGSDDIGRYSIDGLESNWLGI